MRALAIVLLLATPTALAARVELDLQAPKVVLSGLVEATATGAAYVADGDVVDGQIAFRVVSATLRIVTWYSPSGPMLVPYDNSTRDFELRDVDLIVSLDAEPLILVVAAGEEGRVSHRLEGVARGAPFALPNPLTGGGDVAPLSPQRVDYRWEAGWLYAGSLSPENGTSVGMPHSWRATGAFEGDVEVGIDGGTLRARDVNGQEIVERLGRASSPVGPMGLAPRDVYQRAILTGTVASGSSPSAPRMGFASPSPEWRADDSVVWPKATGRATIDGKVVSFRDARIEVRGPTSILPSQPAIGAANFIASSPDAIVFVDGASVATVEGTSLDAPRAIGLAALLAIALRVAFALYARIRRADVLDHPRRQRLFEIASQTPGIHLRELQRQSGLGWGGFVAHLRLLLEAGILRVERQGRYRVVLPAGATASSWLPSAKQREVLRLLDEANAPVALADCRDRLGMSRQLLDHHLKALEARGLVRIDAEHRMVVKREA